MIEKKNESAEEVLSGWFTPDQMKNELKWASTLGLYFKLGHCVQRRVTIDGTCSRHVFPHVRSFSSHSSMESERNESKLYCSYVLPSNGQTYSFSWCAWISQDMHECILIYLIDLCNLHLQMVPEVIHQRGCWILQTAWIGQDSWRQGVLSIPNHRQHLTSAWCL